MIFPGLSSTTSIDGLQLQVNLALYSIIEGSLS